MGPDASRRVDCTKVSVDPLVSPAHRHKGVVYFTPRVVHPRGMDKEPDHIVYIVDDDSRIRDALSALLSTFDLHVVTFASAAEYITYPKPGLPACLILDVELPDINGLDLQSQAVSSDHPQIVFITGHGDIPSSVRAMKAGAVDFLTKPFNEADLMRAVQAALALDREAKRKATELAGLRQRLATMTPRQR